LAEAQVGPLSKSQSPAGLLGFFCGFSLRNELIHPNFLQTKRGSEFTDWQVPVLNCFLNAVRLHILFLFLFGFFN
jgi:hypothetical protein